MKIPIFQADAFASNLFKGNPAAVVPLNKWLPEQLMQLIAAENNLSETAFFIPEDDHFYILNRQMRVESSSQPKGMSLIL